MKKWKDHEITFLGQFVDALKHPLKGKWDPKKVVEKALGELSSSFIHLKRGENAQFQSTYSLTKFLEPSLIDEEAAFFEKVREITKFYQSHT